MLGASTPGPTRKLAVVPSLQYVWRSQSHHRKRFRSLSMVRSCITVCLLGDVYSVGCVCYRSEGRSFFCSCSPVLGDFEADDKPERCKVLQHRHCQCHSPQDFQRIASSACCTEISIVITVEYAGNSSFWRLKLPGNCLYGVVGLPASNVFLKIGLQCTSNLNEFGSQPGGN
jgi:hypothetical protein